MRGECSVLEGIVVERGCYRDYEELSGFHYLGAPCRPNVGVFILRDRDFGRGRFVRCAGVIVYVMPSMNLGLRTVATGGMFTGYTDRRVGIRKVNENIRCISRVIIDPRYRGLGLGARLVRETMGLMGVPIIEAMAAMGRVNPFFEKAGMTAYYGKPLERVERMKEAFGVVGVDEDELIDPVGVQRRLGRMRGWKRGFIERETGRFLQAYGKRKNMASGIGRTRFVLSKLGDRSVYYIWFNGEGGQNMNHELTWSSIAATKMIYHEEHEGHEEKVVLTTDYADVADYFRTGLRDFF